MGFLFSTPDLQQDPPDLTIPLLGDTQKESVGNGVQIPLVYAKGWVGGNVIWLGPVELILNDYPVRVQVSKSSFETVHNYEYVYCAAIAVAVGQGPVNSIRIAKANSSVLFDRKYKFVSGVNFYSGTETQEPDPVIEAYEGAGNVPAFLGLSYIVFEAVELARSTSPMQEVYLPQFEFFIDGLKTTVHNYEHSRDSVTVNGRMFTVPKEIGHYEPLTYSQFSNQDIQPLSVPVTWTSALATPDLSWIYSRWYALETAHPADVDIDVYGQASDGQDMIAVRIMDDGIRPIFIISQGIHGDERDIHYSLRHCAREFIENNDNDPVIEYLQDHVTLYILPTINPYGMSSGGYSEWGTSGDRNNANGVNLNRNWPYFWDAIDSDEKGDSAASEPETYKFIKFMESGGRVDRVLMCLDTHGWNSRNEWGLLTEQIYHSRRTQKNQRAAMLYPKHLLQKRDLTGVTYLYDRPVFTEYRSHHKPYLYTWVKSRSRYDSYCGIFEYPQKESVLLANIVFLDLFHGMLMAMADAIEDEVGGFVINKAAPAPENNNNFFTDFNDDEDRPSWFSKNGLSLKHFKTKDDAEETRSFVRCFRPDDSSWPTPTYSAACVKAESSGQYVIVGGENDTGVISTVNSRILDAGDIRLGSPCPESLVHAAMAIDDTHMYVAGGWDGSAYSDKIHKVPIPEEPTPATPIAPAEGGRVQFWETMDITLPKAVQRHTAHYYDGGLIVIGGRDNSGYLTDIARIDLVTGAATALGSLSVSRGWHTSQLVGDIIYIFGGWDGANTSTACEKIDLTTNTVSLIDSLPNSRAEQSSVYVAAENAIYLFFGRSGSTHYPTIYKYDIDTDTLSKVTYDIASSAIDDADDYDDETSPTISYEIPSIIGSCAVTKTDDEDIEIACGQYEDGTYSERVWEFDRSESLLYLQNTSYKRWGYLRPTTVFYGSPGDKYYLTCSVRNDDPVNDSTNAYIRLVVYIGPLVSIQRKVKLGYTVPTQSSEGYTTFSLPFELRTGETEFRVYYRQYSGNTTIDVGQLTVVKADQGLVPTPTTGRAADSYEVAFREPINNPSFVNPGYKEITYWSAYNGKYMTRKDKSTKSTFDILIGDVFDIDGQAVGTNSQMASGIFSPLWGCQMDVSEKIMEFVFESGLDLDAAEVHYEATEGTPEIDPATGLEVYEPNGRLYFKYRLQEAWYEETIFEDFSLNHSRLNREFRCDQIQWSIATYRGLITFDFHYYGLYKAINIAGGYPDEDYDAYSCICYGATSNATGVIMRASRNLSTIMTDLCERAGVPSDEIDTSELVGSLTGYVLAKQTSFKAFIDPLREGFMFDVIDGETLRFVTRGNASVESIDVGDLIPYQDHKYKITRTQEAEVPNQVNVVYIDEDRSYEQGTQYASRASEYGVGSVTVTLPIAMTADDAAQAADRILYSTWAARVSYALKLPYTKIYLEPGDTITLVDSDKSMDIQLTTVNDLGDHLEVKGIGVDGLFYTSNATGETGELPEDIISSYRDSLLYPLDIPYISDLSDSMPSGFYYAVSYDESLAGRWSGARVDRSTDGELTWASVGLVTTAAVTGVSTEALPEPSRFTVTDEKNTVEIVLDRGELESKTDYDIIHNFSNFAVLGNEIIAFRNATLTAERTYTLSGLYRGIQGTEEAAGVHTDTDQFVLLNQSSLNRIDYGANDLHKEREYRAPTLYTSSDSATSQPFTNSGEGIRPYSPCNLIGARSGSDIEISWTRRDRLANQWNDGSDIPMSETTESYEIDVLDGTDTVLRTLTSATQSVTYTETQQITDFGSAQASVKVRVYQLSSVVGRGHKLEGTI